MMRETVALFTLRHFLKSFIQLLTASIRIDWFFLPSKNFVDRIAIPTTRIDKEGLSDQSILVMGW